MSDRPAVPNEVKRRLRQEAGFGCCFCGHPFLTYHHIVPYAEDQHFRADDMMVVCDNCHRACTNGALTMREQRQAKARARNVVEGLVRGRLYVTSDKLTVLFAGGVAINTPRLLSAGDRTIVGAKRCEDGRVLMSALVQNSEGRFVAQLSDNDWTADVSQVWDFECSHRQATVRSGPGDINFSIDCRSDQLKLQGKWSFNGSVVEFSPSICKVGGGTLMGFHVEDCGGFLHIG